MTVTTIHPAGGRLQDKPWTAPLHEAFGRISVAEPNATPTDDATHSLDEDGQVLGTVNRGSRTSNKVAGRRW